METFTLYAWLLIAGQSEPMIMRDLSQGQCEALAEEIERTQAHSGAVCRGKPKAAMGGMVICPVLAPCWKDGKPIAGAH